MAACLDPRVSISRMYYINHGWRLVDSHPRREMNTWAHGQREAMTVVAVGHRPQVQNTAGNFAPAGPDRPPHRRVDQSQCGRGPTANEDAQRWANEDARRWANEVQAVEETV